MKKKYIYTSEREIYNKLNKLNLDNEVIINTIHFNKIEKIINNINKGERLLDMKKYDDHLIIRKIGNVILNVNLRNSDKYIYK